MQTLQISNPFEKTVPKAHKAVGMEFVREQRCSGCKKLSELPFSFYLPEYQKRDYKGRGRVGEWEGGGGRGGVRWGWGGRGRFGVKTLLVLEPIYNQLSAMNSKRKESEGSKFMARVLAMMKDFPQIINWSHDGMELQIYNVQMFTTKVHPLYFTTSSYKSFLRQLNMYNFSKMSKRKNSINFRHSHFSKDHHHLDSIKRRKQNTRDSLSKSHSPPSPPLPNPLPSFQQNTSSPLSSQLRQLLSELKWALEGRAGQALGRLEGCLAVLQEGSKEVGDDKQVSQDGEMFKEFLSMHKIQRLAESNKEVFTESDFGYNLQQSIFNQPQP